MALAEAVAHDAELGLLAEEKEYCPWCGKEAAELVKTTRGRSCIGCVTADQDKVARRDAAMRFTITRRRRERIASRTT